MTTYRAMYKSELAQLFPCSRTTLGKYLRSIEHLLPHYSRKQTLLTPDQVRVVCEHFCLDMHVVAR